MLSARLAALILAGILSSLGPVEAGGTKMRTADPGLQEGCGLSVLCGEGAR